MENDISREAVRSEGTPTTRVSAQDLPPGVFRDERGRGRRPHYVSVLGPVLLIVAGSVFLLNNLGILPWNVWSQVWRLWPIIPIVIGLDMIIGRRSPALSFLVVLGVITAGVGILYNNGGFEQGVTTGSTSLNVSLDEAKSARVKLDFGAGDLALSSLGTTSDQLASGTLTYSGRNGTPDIDSERKDGTLQLDIKQKSGGFGSWFGSDHTRANWDIKLNPTVPLDLDVSAGASTVNLDLAGLQVSKLKLDVGASDTTLTFPAKGPNTTAEINAGAASVRLVIPQGVAARINLSSAASSVNVPGERFAKNGDAYETQGYATAERKITINLDAGAASINVETK